jgi:hypothetical protein
MSKDKDLLIIILVALVFIISGCSFESIATRAAYENKLNPKLNLVDTSYFIASYGAPKEITGRTWSYYFEKVGDNYEICYTMSDNYESKEFEILYVTFNEKGIFVGWDILFYQKSWFSKMF